mmetsp:Transcript_10226/g.41400  ORF Transcript_10226/g.41400 Transcript_10226/m.41400 type:complete len:604 (-) Transcript_10226:710-2521(-)
MKALDFQMACCNVSRVKTLIACRRTSVLINDASSILDFAQLIALSHCWLKGVVRRDKRSRRLLSRVARCAVQRLKKVHHSTPMLALMTVRNTTSVVCKLNGDLLRGIDWFVLPLATRWMISDRDECIGRPSGPGCSVKTPIGTMHGHVQTQTLNHLYWDEVCSLELAVCPRTRYRQRQAGPKLNWSAAAPRIQWRWVHDQRSMCDMATRLATVAEVALGMERNSWRCFYGVACLMEISLRGVTVKDDALVNQLDFLIDLLVPEVRRVLPNMLGATLTNFNIVKVAHRADSWAQHVQRDLRLCCVNIIDIRIACEELAHTSNSPNHTMESSIRYNYVKNKRRCQLADWLQRPLPVTMRECARLQTHFILLFYDFVRNELGSTPQLHRVLELSNKVRLRVHDSERLRQQQLRTLLHDTLLDKISKRKLDPVHIYHSGQLGASLCIWQSHKAKREDVSHGYVLSSANLVKLILQHPTTRQGVMELLGPHRSRTHASEVATTVLDATIASDGTSHVVSEVGVPSASMFAYNCSVIATETNVLLAEVLDAVPNMVPQGVRIARADTPIKRMVNVEMCTVDARGRCEAVHRKSDRIKDTALWFKEDPVR